MKIQLGRYVYGAAAIGFGAITLAWQDFNGWQQIQPLGNLPHRAILVNLAAAVEILGGAAILWTKTARAGAAALGCLYLFFALTWVPRIAAEPLVYDRWGNFFEQFSIVCGALIACAMLSPRESGRAGWAARTGYFGFGVCVISFTLEQALYLKGTASFVPAWIPPGQMFWAVATTVFFALAAIALLSGRVALPAARLTTAMIAGFGLLVWLPAPFAEPHQIISWAGNAQNTAILGAAWIVADYLGGRNNATQRIGQEAAAR